MSNSTSVSTLSKSKHQQSAAALLLQDMNQKLDFCLYIVYQNRDHTLCKA